MARKGIEIHAKALDRQLKLAMQKCPKETVKAVNDCVLDLAGESARRAPIESGDLRNNCHGTVQGTTVFENKSSVPASVPANTRVVGVVGYSLPYALRQHEDLSLDHNKDPEKYGYKVPAVNVRTGEWNKTAGKTYNMVAGGEAKFLENPFRERLPAYMNRFKKIVEGSIE